MRFGLGVSQSAERDAVGQASRAEALGFDFVTLTDHLVGAPTYETWTQLTWIAAKTERVGLVTNVLGMPYRAPGVLAKMAETLDRLSGGRLVLGLGAGGNNDEFRALGVAVRSKAEKIAALAEALAVIRGLWTTAGFSFEGEHYRVEDATLQPKPERPIPIWLGTYGPRALRLTGREADGWLPSMPYAPPGRYVKLRDIVRAAAEEAGRDPDEIEYAYNVSVVLDEHARARDDRAVAGSAAQVADRLIGLVRDLGVTTLSFWVRGDEARAQLAEEVLPAIREAG